MEEITREILDVDLNLKSRRGFNKTRNFSLGKERVLISSGKKDLRHYSTKTSFMFSSFYSKKREADFKLSRLVRW